MAQISYGGNQTLNMVHQRQITFEYETRPDVSTKYIGGSKVTVDKRLMSISSFVQSKLVNQHVVTFDKAPLTGVTRVTDLTLVDSSGAAVRPLNFDWVNGSPSVFEAPQEDRTLDILGAEVNMMPMDVQASGRSDAVIASKVTVSGVARTRIATHLSDANGHLATQPSFVNSDLMYHVALFPLDVNGDGKTDLVSILLSSFRGT